MNNIPLSEHSGLQLFNLFWSKNNTSKIIDEIQPKKSGNDFSSIVKNLTIGKLIGCNSLDELCSKTEKEILLSCNTQIHRSNLSRNMNKLNHNKQTTILTRLVECILPTLNVGKRAKEDALQILDGSALEVTGETFEDAKWVHDSRVGGTVWGYEVLTHMINIGEYSFPINSKINNLDKEDIIKMFEDGRTEFGIPRVAFDAGFRSMDFFYELNNRGFKFYTKATMNWHWNFHSFDRQTDQLAKLAKQKFHRNHQYVEFIVEKEVDEGKNKGKTMTLRLVFVKDDKRVFITNDFDSSAKKVYWFYCRRWKIEEMFKEEKQNLGFEKLTVRKINAIKTHLMTVFLAFIFCQLILKKFPSIKGIKLLVRNVINHLAEIIISTQRIIVKFVKNFKYRFALEKLI